jgi:hypothetical protein
MSFSRSNTMNAYPVCFFFFEALSGTFSFMTIRIYDIVSSGKIRGIRKWIKYVHAQ